MYKKNPAKQAKFEVYSHLLSTKVNKYLIPYYLLFIFRLCKPFLTTEKWMVNIHNVSGK